MSRNDLIEALATIEQEPHGGIKQMHRIHISMDVLPVIEEFVADWLVHRKDFSRPSDVLAAWREDMA